MTDQPDESIPIGWGKHAGKAQRRLAKVARPMHHPCPKAIVSAFFGWFE